MVPGSGLLRVGGAISSRFLAMAFSPSGIWIHDRTGGHGRDPRKGRSLVDGVELAGFLLGQQAILKR